MSRPQGPDDNVDAASVRTDSRGMANRPLLTRRRCVDFARACSSRCPGS
jgi:hypothetical protein